MIAAFADYCTNKWQILRHGAFQVSIKIYMYMAISRTENGKQSCVRLFSTCSVAALLQAVSLQCAGSIYMYAALLGGE